MKFEIRYYGGLEDTFTLNGVHIFFILVPCVRVTVYQDRYVFCESVPVTFVVMYIFVYTVDPRYLDFGYLE